MLLATLLFAFCLAVAAFKVEPVGTRDDGVVTRDAEEVVLRAAGANAYFVEFHNNYVGLRFL
jgi:hypothetical protein